MLCDLYMLWLFPAMNKLLPNSFPTHIDKEDVQAMPNAQFEGEVVIVDSAALLSKAIDYLQQQDIIGVDTEARPSFQRGVHYPTALVQIATEERCFLFRLTHIGLPKMLADIFANPAICKVGLAFRDDIKGLRRRREFVPANCVDIQSVVANYGIMELGLQKIFAIIFGKRISKSQQLTNWENNHLTPEQAKYAATDAWATLMIYKKLRLTKPLPKREVIALKRAELEAQQLHQQQVLAQRQAALPHDNN